MSIKRSRPRRPASWYPLGSTLTLRDGRRFEVATKPVSVWDDPTLGNGGGTWVVRPSRPFWRAV